MNKFITFEGGEGSGKTTQSKKLYQYLIDNNFSAIWTREIGGTELGEKIRDLIINNKMLTKTELLLVIAARNEHIENVIKPALAEGKYVICDRFIDSTAAYQAEDIAEMKNIFYLNQTIIGDFMPSLTIYMNLDPEIALKRAIARGDTNKYEDKPMEFHKRIAAHYKFLSSQFSFRIQEIDGSLNEKVISELIINKFHERFIK